MQTEFPKGLRTFRLIPYEVQDPVTNMAIDEALLELHIRGKCPPTLRFYGWEPAAVSFGYSQKVSERVSDRLKELGLGMVRRPTGGRAVLHQGELTYSYVGPVGSKSVQQDYKEICRAFIIGLEKLGVEVELGRADSGYRSHEDCFEATTLADLHHKGSKLVGSAQLRRKDSLLQHGSVILDQKQDAMAYALGLGSFAKTKENQEHSESQTALASKRHACLKDLVEVDRTSLEEAIGFGFSKVFDCTFSVYDLTFEEWQVVDSLKSDPEKYRV